METKVAQRTEHLFRKEYSRLVSVLTARYGRQKLELAEDAVQDALVKAMQVWGFQGIPEKPSAWLYRVASNKLIDDLRKERPMTNTLLEVNGEDLLRSYQIEDDQLRMLFACCHPALKQQDQIILSLKILAGLHLKEIASALFKTEEAVKKQYQRARKKFRIEVGEIELPSEKELEERLNSVLKVIYLIFNEGYSASFGNDLIRMEICEEALVLALMLRKNTRFNKPEVNALIALFCFSMARMPARTNNKGELVILAEQDRSKWDPFLVKEGLKAMSKASSGEKRSAYHLEAGISGIHSTAKFYKDTDWPAILYHYDALLSLTGSPIVALNRIVAFAKVHGSERGLEELYELDSDEHLHKTPLLFSIKAQLYFDMGRRKKGGAELEKAIGLANNDAERRHLEKMFSKYAE